MLCFGDLSYNYIIYLGEIQQGIVDMNRNGDFCKETWVIKVIAEAKVDACVEQQKKFTRFSRMFAVMANLLCFGCFAAG